MNKRDVQTSDIVLAATLKCKKYALDRIEKTGSRGTFVFTSVHDSDMVEFDLGRCLVEPVAFNQAIKSLTQAVKRHIS